MALDRIHWPVGEPTRCGIRVVRRQSISRHGTTVANRRIYAGQPVDIPRFLELEDRCRHCARKLRNDTGLLRNVDRERLPSRSKAGTDQ